jgi:hypothetical protein
MTYEAVPIVVSVCDFSDNYGFGVESPGKNSLADAALFHG